MSFDYDFQNTGTKIDKATIIKNKIREKLIEKKKKKILSLTEKNRAKHFKKYLLLKRYDEDDLNKALSEE